MAQSAALAAATIAIRLLYESVYDSLGTSVDEVGVSPWHMTETAVFVLLSLYALVALGILGASLLLDAATPLLVRFRGHGSSGSDWAVVSLVLIGCEAVMLPRLGEFIVPVLVLGGAAVVAVVLFPPTIVRGSKALERSLRVCLWAGVGILIVAYSVAFVQADDLAAAVGTTRESPFPASALISIEAEPVVVALRGAGCRSLEADERPGGLLLGESEGLALLFDVGERRLFRVSTDGLVLVGADIGGSAVPALGSLMEVECEPPEAE